ncbi:hypothetical protein OAP76_00740 [Alphaproteobacteria bacterium]|nr:hypothetical protein [Alphaproteobacteria bacterium]
MKDKSDTKPPVKDVSKDRKGIPANKSKAFETPMASEKTIKGKVGKLKAS